MESFRNLHRQSLAAYSDNTCSLLSHPLPDVPIRLSHPGSQRDNNIPFFTAIANDLVSYILILVSTFSSSYRPTLLFSCVYL